MGWGGVGVGYNRGYNLQNGVMEVDRDGDDAMRRGPAARQGQGGPCGGERMHVWWTGLEDSCARGARDR